MTVVVSGGSGLVGSHVIAALRARGERVRALARPESRSAVERLGVAPEDIVPGDVRDPAVWARAAEGARGVVHAAALVAPRAPLDLFLDVNVGGTRCAIAAARGAGARLVHISSVAVYGRTGAYAAGAGAVREDFPFGRIAGRDFYARSKRAAEEAVAGAAAEGGLEAAMLRPNVIYGERDRLFSPRVARAVRQRLAPRIGPGTNHLSCVYAGNVAAAVVAALEAPPALFAKGARAFNVTDDGPGALTQSSFVNAFAEELGVRLVRFRLPYFAARLAVDAWARVQMLRFPGRYPGIGRAAVGFLAGENPFVAERARRELGWEPPVPAREAVRRTACWILENEKPGR